MKYRRFFALTLFFLIITQSSLLSAELAAPRYIAIASRDAMSAWTQPKNSYYNQLSYTYHESKEKFTTMEEGFNGQPLGMDDDVHKTDTSKFSAETITYHGELGLTERLTIFTAIPYIDTYYEDVRSFSDSDGPSGIGDIRAGLRFKLSDNILDSGTVMSMQGTVKIPEAYDCKDPILHANLGDGQYDLLFDLLFGKDWEEGYVMFHTGYTYRFKNSSFYDMKPSDQFRLLLGGTFRASPRARLTLSLNWTNSVGNSSIDNDIFDDTIAGRMIANEEFIIKDTLGLEQDILTLGLSATLDFKPGVHALIHYQNDIKGFDRFGSENTADISTYTIGVGLSF